MELGNQRARQPAQTRSGSAARPGTPDPAVVLLVLALVLMTMMVLGILWGDVFETWHNGSSL